MLPAARLTCNLSALAKLWRRPASLALPFFSASASRLTASIEQKPRQRPLAVTPARPVATSQVPPPPAQQPAAAAAAVSTTTTSQPAPAEAPASTSSGSGGGGISAEKPPLGCSAAALAALPLEQIKQLQTAGLQIQDKIKMGRRGVAIGLVRQVKQRWNSSEIARLYCQGKHAADMKAVVAALEEKTGGLVVFRAGGTVLLYRGPQWQPSVRPRKAAAPGQRQPQQQQLPQKQQQQRDEQEALEKQNQPGSQPQQPDEQQA